MTKLVKFLLDANLEGAIDKPVPANKQLPEWFKNLPTHSTAHPESNTAKKCVPILESCSMGFIIPLWSDVFVVAENGSIKIDFPRSFPMPEALGQHSYEQIDKHPLSNHPYGDIPMKWINPWIIETAKGYSCLFTSPFNHLETRFKLLDGVVDTDNFYNPVNLPFLWTGGDGEFLIKKGTPLVQVIPFKRDTYKCEVGVIDASKRSKAQSKLGLQFSDSYRKSFWHRTQSKNRKWWR